ncbi:unnamed protein product [Mucor circinelloides]
MIQTLPQELLLRIGDNLDPVSRWNLASTSKYTWKSFTTPVESLYKLNGAVPTLLLHKLKHVHIQNKYCSSNVITALLHDAKQLKSIHFAYRSRYDYQFLQLFIARNITRELIYYVSSNAVDIFQVLIDSQGITNITVQPHPRTIEEASCIVTPEHINRHIQLIKDDMKLDRTRSQTMVKY